MPSLDRLHKPVLVLNASYEPINVCAARRALVLVLKGVASAEEQESAYSFGAADPAPAVRDPPARIPAHPAPDARAVAQEHPDARPLHVPVLPQDAAVGRTDARPRDSALARRRDHVGESGGLLPSVQ